jgi:hypothetical protein
MRTQTFAHRLERVALPRRLVPRRRMVQSQSHFVSEFYDALDNSPPRYAVGDMLEFSDNQGRSHFVTNRAAKVKCFVGRITEPDGVAECM